jgi:AcrR family transcriptional regulator
MQKAVEARVLKGGRKGDRTADRILEAALDQFSRLGFERVTMGGIAEIAQVSQATLHYHFQDKMQLWKSAISMLAHAIEEEGRLMDATRDMAAIDALKLAMRFFLQVSWKHPALGRIVALEGAAGGERLQWLVETFLGPRNRRMMNLVTQAIADGELKPFPPEQIVIMLQTGAVGAINLTPLMKAIFDYDATTPHARAAHDDMVIDAMLAGLMTNRPHKRESAT